jgi:hypothetical protein
LKDAIYVLQDDSISLEIAKDMFKMNAKRNPGMEKAYHILTRI